jgi:mono/diheme cytochrome c family protein
MHRISRLTLATMCLALCGLRLHAVNSDPRGSSAVITPAAGESWLNHLHRSFGDTSMGKTGRLGPPPASDGERAAGWQLGLLSPQVQNVSLRGADLYRLNCQSCHGEGGLGTPPEIHSMIDPVRATSVPLVVERMKQRGFPITPAAAAELAKQSEAALLDRLHKGGESMPPFPQLNDSEVRALIAYLKQLAKVPGATQITVAESPVRVGELIVKSTCHICHDATGPNPTPEQLLYGAIPPLETLTTRTDELELIRKVTSGAPIVMGSPATPHRGRMPVFYYLSREEAAEVYLYLTSYPPSEFQDATSPVAATQEDKKAESGPSPGSGSPPPHQSRVATPGPASSDGIPDGLVTLLLIGAGVFALGMTCVGLGFAAYELRRLGRDGETRTLELSDKLDSEHELHELAA